MSEEQLVSLYLELNKDIHAYWGGFGAVAVLLFGWILSRSSRPSLSQRLALTFGWLVAGGYLASSLMGSYRVLDAVTQDVAARIATNPGGDSHILKAVREYAPIYGQYEILVSLSSSLITVCVLFVIWSNILSPKTKPAAVEANKKLQRTGEDAGR